MLLIAYSKLGNIFWLKFDETSHKAIHNCNKNGGKRVGACVAARHWKGMVVIWAREKSEMAKTKAVQFFVTLLLEIL